MEEDISAIYTPEVVELMRNCVYATGNFCSTFMPERFFRPFSSLHTEIFNAIDGIESQQILILAPRGFGKTSTISIGYPAKQIVNRLCKYIVPVSATSTSAVLQSENLKSELTTNESINVLYGPQKSDRWSTEFWVSSGGTAVMPRGAGQQIRGLLFDRYRPDLILVDDLETSEGVKSDEQRAKLRNWFFSDLVNSVDRGSKDWKIVVIGTILHEDCLLVHLKDDPEWTVIELELCDDNLKSNWPDFMDDAGVLKLYEAYKSKGMLDTFYREYRNKPIASEDATFRKDYFQHHVEPLDSSISRDMVNVIIVDPAKTVKMHSADSAIVCVGVSRSTHKIYVREYEADKLYPEQIYDKAFSMATRWRARVLAIEVTGLNEFVKQPIENERLRRGSNVNLLWLNARRSKEERIAALVPYYRQKFISHNIEYKDAELERQLCSFPASSRLDIMDALAYIIPIMDEEYQYFYPPDFDGDEGELEALYDELLESSEDAIKRRIYI